MNPEEARARLHELLDGQAEMRRQAPTVYFVESDEPARGGQRRFVRIFAVDPDMDIVCLDFWIRVASGIPATHVGDNRVQRPGQYTPERGWRVDGSMQPTEADVYDLLMGALAPSGITVEVDFVRSIQIRMLY